jgi:acyl carrier protein
MNQETIRQTILEALGGIVPEADLASIEPDLEFREQLDMDSMDLLNFVIAVDERLGVEIPEVDYPKLATLDDCVAYVSARLVAV